MPPGPMVLRLAWDEQYYTQDDFLLWYGRERGFEIWEEAGNVEDSDGGRVAPGPAVLRVAWSEH